MTVVKDNLLPIIIVVVAINSIWGITENLHFVQTRNQIQEVCSGR